MSVFPRLFSNGPNRATRRRLKHRSRLDPKIEHQVDLTNRWKTTSSTSYVFDEDRLIALIDPARFTSPSYYFEAVIFSDVSGISVYADLYNVTDGVAVTNSEVSTSLTTAQRVRSGALTLPGTAKEYTFRIRVDSGAMLTNHAARIIIVDTYTTLTTLEHQVEIGTEGATSLTTFMNPAYPKVYYHEGDKFDGTVTIYFEADIYVSAKTGEARLYNVTDGVEVTNSTVSTSSTSLVRVRSGAITLASGKEYRAQYRNPQGKTIYFNGAKIIIQQTGTPITKTQIIKNLVTNFRLITLSEYTRLRYQIYLDKGNLPEGLTFYYEADLEESVACSDLFNVTDDIPVSGSEVCGTGRHRSGSITLPSLKEYDSRLGTTTPPHAVTIRKGYLIIDYAAPPPVRYFTETLIISDRHIRTARYSRAFKLDLSILRDIFTFIYAKAPIVRKIVETLIISVALVRRHSGIRALRQDLSVLRDVFSFIYTPIVPPVYRFVQNLSVISDLFRRRVAYKRKQVEVVYVQVKAIIKKIKKWLAWLTRRMRLSIERPQHAEFKL